MSEARGSCRTESQPPDKRRKRMGQGHSAQDFSAQASEVFAHIPAQELVCVCRLVCREWKELVDSTYLWKDRCRREGYEPSNVTSLPEDWCKFYFLCKKRRNLLKNPRAEEQFKGWKIEENGGDEWRIEDVSPRHHLPDRTVQKFFVTSYDSCIKSQLIDLAREGYGPKFMDEIQPDIIVTDWYSPRWDCGCIYEVWVELLDQKKKVIQKFSPDPVSFPQWNSMQWEQMKHVFSGYGPGVRFIKFTHGGKDTQFWAGWYGIRVTNSSVKISPFRER